MNGFVDRQFDSGDVSINVAEWADNGPPLLFIHGIPSDWSTWEKIVPAFVTDWHCFAVDLRGHGKSGHIPGGYHRDLYTAELVARQNSQDLGRVLFKGRVTMAEMIFPSASSDRRSRGPGARKSLRLYRIPS